MKPLLAVLLCVLAACKTSGAKAPSPTQKATASASSPAGSGRGVGTAPAKAVKKRPSIEAVASSVTLAAGVDTVWRLVSGVEDWGAWNERVTRVDPGLGLGAGATVTWAWDDTEVVSTIVTVRNGQEFAFRTSPSSKRVLMRWMLEKKSHSLTAVTLKAEVPYGTAGEIMKKLDEEVKEWLAALQAAAQK